MLRCAECGLVNNQALIIKFFSYKLESIEQKPSFSKNLLFEKLGFFLQCKKRKNELRNQPIF